MLAAAALAAVGLVGPARAEDPGPVAEPAVVAEDLTVDAPPAPAPEASAEEDASAVAAVVETADGGLEVVTVPTEPGDAADAVAALERDPDVVDAFVDVPATIAATDPRRHEQWGLEALNLAPLPDGTPDGSDQIVAVVDTGVRASHPDLDVPGPVQLGRVRCDLGADFTLTSLRSVGNGCTDPHGHGTHVAGTVSAIGENGVGIAGVSAAQVMPVRVLDPNGEGVVSRIVAGIIWAVDRGASVINLSIVSSYTTAYDAAVRYALDNDVVVVAAAGNNRAAGNAPQSPASTTGVIAVAATDEDGLSAPFSYSGPTNLVSAPGADVLSTMPDGTGYGLMSGTSMAAPHVAGVVARWIQAHGRDVDAARTAIRTTAIDLQQPGVDDDTGYGLLNPHTLLTGDPAPVDATRGVLPTTPRQIRVTPGVDGLTVRWTAPVWDGGSPVTSFDVIVAEQIGGALVPVAADSVGPSETEALVGPDLGLERGVGYYVVMTAGNANGQGQFSLPSTAVRIPTAPSAPRIGTPNAGPGAARVRWSAPSSTGGSAITGYVVKAYQGWVPVRQVTVPATARELRLAGLTNGRGHTFVVQAVNAVGTGPHSARSISVTPRQKPGAPRVGRPVPGNDAARVYWAAPTDNGGAYISAYVVKVYQGSRGIRRVTVSGRATNTLVTGLGNRGYYSFTVTAVNVVGPGAQSSRSITVRTT